MSLMSARFSIRSLAPSIAEHSVVLGPSPTHSWAPVATPGATGSIAEVFSASEWGDRVAGPKVDL